MTYESTMFQPVTTRADAEAALDAGRLFAVMANGRFWRCRRNGKTQTWKTRPDDYRIPVKAGLKATGAIEPHTLHQFRVETPIHHEVER